MKYLYKECNNDKKNILVLEKYKNLINENSNKTNRVLLLVPNNSTKRKYEKNIDLEYSEALNISTYINFVKKEITKYWPIISMNCKEIKSKNISPRFINNSLSEYIISEKVSNTRTYNGYFDDIVATNKNISKSIYNNINKAALNLIEFDIIGEKIYHSKKNKDNLMRFSYSQMDEIIKYYIDLLLSNAMLDNSMCIYLYNNYLLNNEKYITKLSREINYLIVDSLEGCSCAEIDFIDTISKITSDSYIYFNETRDYASFNNIDIEYIKSNIISPYLKQDNIDLDDEDCKLHDIDISHIYSINTDIELNQSSQLYSEMLEEVCKKTIELVKSGTEPKDIVIISPVNNSVLDYQVKTLLSKSNILVYNTKKDKKLVDYPYGNALVVASCIFYGYEELIREEEFISFIETILEVNRIQAFKIYRNQVNNDKYNNIREYILNKREDDIKIDEFLIKFYIDKMLNLKYGMKNVNICRQIINESDVFVENISRLELDKDQAKEEIFILALKSSINDYYSALDIEELKESNQIMITTPYSYIGNNIKKPIQLWVDIGSNSWNMKIEKELNNNVVLRKSFKENQVYTDTMEEHYKKYYLNNMIYNLLCDSKKVYAYKSEYTVNGYIQESILYSLLLKILDKGGK